MGQYSSGAVGGQAVAGYADELGKASNTETFVALKAFIDNWRWKGVPFYLRTGKRMPQRQSEVLIQFTPVPHNIFARVGAANLDPKIGRAHVCTPVTNAHLVCILLLETKKTTSIN